MLLWLIKSLPNKYINLLIILSIFHAKTLIFPPEVQNYWKLHNYQKSRLRHLRQSQAWYPLSLWIKSRHQNPRKKQNYRCCRRITCHPRNPYPQTNPPPQPHPTLWNYRNPQTAFLSHGVHLWRWTLLTNCQEKKAQRKWSLRILQATHRRSRVHARAQYRSSRSQTIKFTHRF